MHKTIECRKIGGEVFIGQRGETDGAGQGRY